MKSRKVNTVTSDEEMVRLDIFEGRIPLENAGDRLLELALAQHHRGGAYAGFSMQLLSRLEALHKVTLLPWPVRWWRYFIKCTP